MNLKHDSENKFQRFLKKMMKFNPNDRSNFNDVDYLIKVKFI